MENGNETDRLNAPNLQNLTVSKSNTQTVQISAGLVRGYLDGGLRYFLGVPYAEPPVGVNRFVPPQPVKPWHGERDATLPGPCAPHRIRDFPAVDLTPLVGKGGEEGGDYLALNIWAPQTASAAPVMVFIHGGGFVAGSKDAAVHDGSAFARSGIVCVAINYRLGIEGFLPIPGVPTNLGLRDMIAALQWVRENIAAFGGDPTNLTVFGESAGAMAIADLLTSPLAEGLFRRAIVQSGHGSMVREIPIAQRLVRKLASILRVSPDAAGFSTVDFERGWKAMQKVAKPFARLDLRDSAGHEPVFGISRFVPVIGDNVLPQHPLSALANGAGSNVDLLIGTNTAEMNLYFVPTRVREKIPGWLVRWMIGKSNPNARKALLAYGIGTKGKKPGHAMTEALSDMVFRWPARQFAAAHQGRTHMYEFDWHSPAVGGELGACHGIELGFVFDTLRSVTGPSGIAGESPPEELAKRVHGLWVQFAKDGSLPWPEFEIKSRIVYHLANGETVNEPVMGAAVFLP
ncbi:MAG: carboxylesterase family protein [Sphingomicrobium sp.]